MFIMQNDRAEKKSREKESTKTHWALNMTWVILMLFRFLFIVHNHSLISRNLWSDSSSNFSISNSQVYTVKPYQTLVSDPFFSSVFCTSARVFSAFPINYVSRFAISKIIRTEFNNKEYPRAAHFSREVLCTWGKTSPSCNATEIYISWSDLSGPVEALQPPWWASVPGEPRLPLRQNTSQAHPSPCSYEFFAAG